MTTSWFLFRLKAEATRRSYYSTSPVGALPAIGFRLCCFAATAGQALDVEGVLDLAIPPGATKSFWAIAQGRDSNPQRARIFLQRGSAR